MTTLPELEAVALSFGVDISAASSKQGEGTVFNNSPTLKAALEVVARFAMLSPRNRYLLARTVWVMFDLDAEVPKVASESLVD